MNNKISVLTQALPEILLQETNLKMNCANMNKYYLKWETWIMNKYVKIGSTSLNNNKGMPNKA